jgi:hypothetical protein
MITQARLIELYEYDPKWGLFSNRRTGRVERTLNTAGFVKIMVDGVPQTAHRLAWLWVHGELPNKHLMHLDGDRTNNSIKNLALGRDLSEKKTKSNNKECMPLSDVAQKLREAKFERRLATLLKNGYQITGNHLVRITGENTSEYIVGYVGYINRQIID